MPTEKIMRTVMMTEYITIEVMAASPILHYGKLRTKPKKESRISNMKRKTGKIL